MLELTLSLKNQAEIEYKLDGTETSHTSKANPLLFKSQQAFDAFVRDPRPHGEKLYQALFPEGSPAEEALQALDKAPADERLLVLIPTDPILDSIPWEYAWDGERLLACRYALVRSLPADQRIPVEIPGMERLPLLFLPANPLTDKGGHPLTHLDVETEWLDLCRGVTEGALGCDLHKLFPATMDTLQHHILRLDGKIGVHFSGHGSVEGETASLLFEGESGRADPRPAHTFVDLVRDKAAFVFLSACLSAAPAPTEFANLARLLAQKGVPFAVGMQYPVRLDAAERISEFFYAALLHGNPFPEALRQARMAVSRHNLFQAGIPALYCADPQDAQDGLPVGEGEGYIHLPPPYPSRLNLVDLPKPQSGFLGRQRELAQIGDRIIHKRRGQPLTLTLHGIGGSGKTALLRAAAGRFAWRFPDGVLALSLEPLPPLTEVLGRLERFLGLPELPDADAKSRRQRIRDSSRRAFPGLATGQLRERPLCPRWQGGGFKTTRQGAAPLLCRAARQRGCPDHLQQGQNQAARRRLDRGFWPDQAIRRAALPGPDPSAQR